MRVRTVLEHAQTILPMLSRVQVVVLETVHLAVTLRAAGTDSAHVRSRTLLRLLECETVVDRVVNSKVALAVKVSSADQFAAERTPSADGT